jgi:hypothetical protein
MGDEFLEAEDAAGEMAPDPHQEFGARRILRRHGGDDGLEAADDGAKQGGE